MQQRVLYAISSLWLWHATRSLVIINELLKKDVYIKILSYWQALNFLKEELKDNLSVEFEEFPDYPPLERWNNLTMYFYLIPDILRTKSVIKKEQQYVLNNYKKFDYIYSDWRYWFYSDKILSYLVCHQISVIMPKWLGFLQWYADNFNYRYFKKFDTIMIPDYAHETNNLSWKMSHNKIVEKLKHRYVWPLSSYKKLDIKEDIDYLFMISWYLLEHKDNFINILINEAKNLKWKKVFLLWDTSKLEEKDLENDIKIYSHLVWEKRNELLNRAKIIISRAGYTTIMDLINLRKKAIIIPTPHQTEQIYLAEYLSWKWLFVAWKQNKKLDLKKLLSDLEKCKTCEFK